MENSVTQSKVLRFGTDNPIKEIFSSFSDLEDVPAQEKNYKQNQEEARGHQNPDTDWNILDELDLSMVIQKSSVAMRPEREKSTFKSEQCTSALAAFLIDYDDTRSVSFRELKRILENLKNHEQISTMSIMQCKDIEEKKKKMRQFDKAVVNAVQDLEKYGFHVTYLVVCVRSTLRQLLLSV